jgi:hypothetical protein
MTRRRSFRLHSLDLNGAVLQQRNERADCSHDRSENGANDASGQGKLRHSPALMLDHHTTHIAFVNERPDLAEDVFTASLE